MRNCKLPQKKQIYRKKSSLAILPFFLPTTEAEEDPLAKQDMAVVAILLIKQDKKRYNLMGSFCKNVQSHNVLYFYTPCLAFIHFGPAHKCLESPKTFNWQPDTSYY